MAVSNADIKAERVTVRTFQRIDDPQNGGATIKAGVTLALPDRIAKKLIAEGKAEKVEDADIR